jgi:hypothetical protein
MNALDFLNTIYYGDRACKSICIDCWKSEIKVQLTSISRIRLGDVWNFYNAEDLDDGFIVFEGVQSITIEPTGLIPGDLVISIEASLITDNPPRYLFVLGIGAVDNPTVEVRIGIVAGW